MNTVAVYLRKIDQTYTRRKTKQVSPKMEITGYIPDASVKVICKLMFK